MQTLPGQLFVALLLISFQPAFADADKTIELTKHELYAIAVKKHSTKPRVAELEIFPSERLLISKVSIRLPEKKPVLLPDFEIQLKCVDGRYLVYSMPVGQGNEVLYNVIAFDKNAKVFRRWTFILDAPIVEAIGIRNKDLPSVAWTNITRTDGNTERVVLGLETRVEGKTYFTESTYTGGKHLHTTTGVLEPKK